MTELYLSVSGFMLILLLILMLRIWDYIEWNRSKKYALLFVGAVEVYILLDALFMRGFLSEKGSVFGFRCVVFLFYLMYVIVPYVWHCFMQSYMGIHCQKWIKLLEAIPLIFLLCMVIMSVPTGILWSIDNNRIYVRGQFFGLFALLNLFYYVFAFLQTVYILITGKRKEIKYVLESAVFSAIPLMGILVNTYVIPLYGVSSFQPYCLVVGVLLSYLFMVEHQKNQMESEHKEELLTALELEKDASRRAKEAGKVKTTFLANMSHDIRTPMNAILGFSDMIARNPEDEAVVRNAIAKIQASGDVLLKIINDVLDLSKIESGAASVTEVPSDLMKIAENMRMMFEYSMTQKQICFEIINDMETSCVWCDEIKLQQILVNILNNAVKFTPEGGKITLRYEQSSVTDDAAEYRMIVRDTGIGMDEEFQKHAFEAFERERTSTESRTEGTGLGLAIVKKLVELMGGQVTIHSERGQGTEIAVCLRLRTADVSLLSQDEKAEETDEKLSGTRVLLAEDNELNAEIAIEILKNMGITADRVKDGEACVERIKSAAPGEYQFVLMDIQMPRMNGYEATKQIRSLPEKAKAQIPIVAMTANAFEEDRQNALAAGMDGFIIKPVEVEKMKKTILQICKKENGIVSK